MTYDILHILGSAQLEGSSIARLVNSLACGLDPSRYRIRACFLMGSGPQVSFLERAGVPTDALDWWRGARDPVGAWKFWRRLRRARADIMHIHFGGRSVRGLARAATGGKIVMHLHSRILEPQGPRPVSFSARGADAVVAVSQAVARCVVGGPVRVIYAGLDPLPNGSPTLPRTANSEIILGTAGRLIALKGIEFLLRAVAALQPEFPGLRVEIAGDGPLRKNLEETVSQLGLAERVTFLGWVDDIHRILPRWDVFVMPSQEEGFPLAALDAMVAGLPVVASSVGGIPELVVDGETGCLVPPADVEALVSRLRPLLRHPEQRRRMGASAQARARDQFSLARMTLNFARLYDELMGATQP